MRIKNLFIALLCFFTINLFGQSNYLPTTEQIEAQAKLAASNYFIDINNRLAEIYTSPSGRSEAQKIASVDEYIRLGGTAVPGLRVCLRNFEPVSAATKTQNFIDFNLLEKQSFNLPMEGVTPIDNTGKNKVPTTMCVSVGLIACLSFGQEFSNLKQATFDPNIPFDKDRYVECKEILNYLREFASQSAFQKLVTELYALPKDQMSKFVHDNIVDSRAIASRGIKVPADILVQRSAFADNRPTLFCLTKYRKDGKTKLTITFDASM